MYSILAECKIFEHNLICKNKTSEMLLGEQWRWRWLIKAHPPAVRNFQALWQLVDSDFFGDGGVTVAAATSRVCCTWVISVVVETLTGAGAWGDKLTRRLSKHTVTNRHECFVSPDISYYWQMFHHQTWMVNGVNFYSAFSTFLKAKNALQSQTHHSLTRRMPQFLVLNQIVRQTIELNCGEN